MIKTNQRTQQRERSSSGQGRDSLWEVIEPIIEKQQELIDELSNTIREQNKVIYDLLEDRRKIKKEIADLDRAMALMNPLLKSRGAREDEDE